MKKVVIGLFTAGALVSSANAVDWWLRPTICQPLNANCYGQSLMASGVGFDVDEWDIGAACRGMKIICANAISGALGNEMLSKAEISGAKTFDGLNINTDDFDMAALDSKSGCFGMRKTRNNGTEAKVGADWVKVFCYNVFLDGSHENMPGGYIVPNAGAQPTCEDLKNEGYIGVFNANEGCYGKYAYPESDFLLVCEPGKLLPGLIVKKNGADDVKMSAVKPRTEEETTLIFNAMIGKAAEMQKNLADGE